MRESSRASRERRAFQLRSVLVALATIIAIVGAAIVAFYSPLWIAFAQDRAGVPAITGFTAEQVRLVTGSILADLFFDPPEFAVKINGDPVLGPAERAHMSNVRGVVLPFGGLFLVVIAALAIVVAVNRDRAWVWRAVGWGSTALVLGAVVIGIVVALFFDAAFLLFHRVFFPQGNFMFDPRTQRLVQLFPQGFWFESAVGLVIVGAVLAAVVALVSRRLARRAPRP